MSEFAARRYPAHLKATTRSVSLRQLTVGDVVVWPDGEAATVAHIDRATAYVTFTPGSPVRSLAADSRQWFRISKSRVPAEDR